ncbi:putative regulatory protein, FmdB family [Desulfacinum hydrothermale DSM 13146]|uniref:Putative regulatory protein, FmdB family n=1 Tax=Desulfacinum hydrothermale DSM 13146 TaxID=1121390 RepID=A0A1W1XU36_9BACT|nr:FmdB family zinc ribbon protein [Desulfacinum hydrothermale]SMC27479.1 putative regulatory protein, FmdB family [Desulfacinum hydrothermale DSM 13146]
MPIYEYECTQCGQITEAMQKFSDPPLTECEHCHGELRKLISMSTFHLKGSGWYVTDYAGKKQNANSNSTKSDGSSGGSTEKTSPSASSSSSSDD